MNVALIDYGAGNVPSVERALQKLGADPLRVSRPEDLVGAKAIVLPGVGHYGALIRALDEQGLRVPLVEALLRGTPFLGVCLGLQALYQSSDEAPELRGLGIFPGKVCALPASVKLPHMGWNCVKFRRNSPLLDDLTENDYFYFAHTFAVQTADGETTAVCDYGAEFSAVLTVGRICAVQFHPEKSGGAGSILLRNFLKLAA